MKAIVKARPAPGVEVRDVPVPEPKPGWAQVRVKAVGICGSDVHAYEWTHGYEFMEKSLPLILGHEFSGTVVKVGQGVTNVKVGDRVFMGPGRGCGTCFYCRIGRPQNCLNRAGIGLFGNDGAMAEYVAVPADTLWTMPDNMSFEVGALCEPLAVSVNAVYVSGVRPGQTVVVLGPGPIGLLAILALSAAGPRIAVTGTTADGKRLEVARRLGADVEINVDKEDPVSAVMKLTGGFGADVVYEATGVPETIQQGLDMLRKGGVLVAIGIHARPAKLDLIDFVRSAKTIVGSYGQCGPSVWREEVEMLRRGDIDPTPIVSHRLPLDDAVKGFELARTKQAVKVLFTP